MIRRIELRMLVGTHAIAKSGEATGELGPEGDALPDRHPAVNRAERADMLGHDLPPESDEHGAVA